MIVLVPLLIGMASAVEASLKGVRADPAGDRRLRGAKSAAADLVLHDVAGLLVPLHLPAEHARARVCRRS